MAHGRDGGDPAGAHAELAQLLRRALQGSTRRIDGVGGTAMHPQDLLAAGDRIAKQLIDAGVNRGEPVHVVIANEPADLGALLGVWSAGAVVVPIHHGAIEATVAKVSKATGARFCIRALSLDQIANQPPPDRPALERASLIIFTSGTTGEPKGVIIGHEELSGKIDALARLLNVRSGDVVAVPLSLTFVFGIWTTFVALSTGARLILVSKYTNESMAQLLRDGVTVLPAVPTMLRSLLDAGAPSAPRLRMILTGGESLGGALGEALQTALPGARVYDLYGLTETTSCDFCLLPDEAVAGGGSIGRPTEGVKYRILGADGSDAEAGTSGELEIDSRFRMLGYLDDPQLSEQAYNQGYFRTGDIARLRADGRVELLGRSKEIIVRRGNKISPLEIDNVLAAHPALSAALSAGVPDIRLGETIHVAVVVKQGHKVTVEALRGWAAAHLERYKLPDKFYFVEALPVGRTGKADRKGVAALAGSARNLAPGGV